MRKMINYIEESKEIFIGLEDSNIWQRWGIWRRPKRNSWLSLKELSKKPCYAPTFQLFESAPGVDWFMAIRLALEWGTTIAARFAAEKRLASFTGLTTSEYSTVETVCRGRIIGQSNHAVRAWLIESTWTAYKHAPALLGKFWSGY